MQVSLVRDTMSSRLHMQFRFGSLKQYWQLDAMASCSIMFRSSFRERRHYSSEQLIVCLNGHMHSS